MLSRSLFLLLLLLLALGSGCAMAPSRVAIMDFANATGSTTYEKLEIAVPEYLTLYLANTRGIYLLERQDIHRFLAEIDSDRYDAATLSRWQKLGQKIQAEYLIAGSCSRLDKNFVITARLFNVTTGEIEPNTAIVKTCTSESDIFNQTKVMAAELAWLITRRTIAPATATSTPPASGWKAAPQPTETVTQLPSASERTPVPQWQPVR